MSDYFEPSEERDEGEAKSKTQLKREMEALQDLGAKLLDMNDQQLAKLPLSPALERAIDESKRIRQREARRRHLQYIGKLMREVDVAAIQEAVDRQEAGTRAYIQHFHQLEQWRDQLLAEDDQLAEFLSAYPGADRQHLRQLVRNARKEAERGKPPASARKLFKYIREVDEQAQVDG
ncbi:ribosome biogenesis factor YjgA [Motiliproteus sp. SC1-56]|uniref:ribosome biogenesis factor YjgA n=1 Tax=Motiliproteus sp. SC1-56 TaxID=2799565 RepID=UPI001A8C08DC|nr:ribosome biogenesis factor YjgA [Motiliproteus sp. SC1-56]